VKVGPRSVTHPELAGRNKGCVELRDIDREGGPDGFYGTEDVLRERMRLPRRVGVLDSILE
jgi:hypothetical protein